MIEFCHVSKTYPARTQPGIADISLRIAAGATLALMGSSGSGKTTLLKFINRLLPWDSGEIYLDGVEIRQLPLLTLRRRMGYVIQQIGLFPHFTIAENIRLPLQLAGISSEIQHQRVGELLKLMNLPPEQFAHRYPQQLSGGQQQRVGVARAMAADPPILLFDEPFGALDTLTRQELQAEMLRLKQQWHKTIILVTHDLDEALALGDEVAVLHEGRLQQVATPEKLIAAPANDFVAALIHNRKTTEIVAPAKPGREPLLDV